MELKSRIHEAMKRLTCSFKSHLYGIEINQILGLSPILR